MTTPSGTVGVIGLDVPLEMLDAMDLRPRRIVADPGNPAPEAEPFGEGVGHPLVRALLAALLREQVTHVAIGASNPEHMTLFNLLVSLERLGTGPAMQTTLFDLHRGGTSASNGGREAMARLATSSGKIGPAFGGRLADAIGERNTLRAAQRTIEALRSTSTMTGTRALALHHLAATAPPSVAIAELTAAIGPARAGSVPAGVLPVVYSGSACCASRSYGLIEASGLRVVGDDHDAGSRSIGPDCVVPADGTAVATRPDGIDALLERYRSRDPDPATAPAKVCTAYLLRMVQERGARAVIFDIPAFDHPAAWDLPMKRAALDRRGIPSVIVDPHAYREPDEVWRSVARDVLELVQGAGT